MSHIAKINSIGHEIVPSRTQIGDSLREITQGRTSIGGSGYDILFGIPLTEIDPLKSVKLQEYNYTTRQYEDVEFVIAKHYYEEGLANPVTGLANHNRTLLVRKYLSDEISWSSTSTSDYYADSPIDRWFNNSYKSRLKDSVQKAIGETAFYYDPFYMRNPEIKILSRAVFTLSPTEYGISLANAIHEVGTVIPGLKAPTSAIMYTMAGEENTNLNQKTSWSRCSFANHTLAYIYHGGTDCFGGASGMSHYTRPVFTLPGDTLVNPRTLKIML